MKLVIALLLALALLPGPTLMTAVADCSASAATCCPCGPEMSADGCCCGPGAGASAPRDDVRTITLDWSALAAAPAAAPVDAPEPSAMPALHPQARMGRAADVPLFVTHRAFLI